MTQKKLVTFDLGGSELPEHQLVVNWRPCLMCYGGFIWSGVRSLVIGSSGPEMDELTAFYKGPTNENWVEDLEKRVIEAIPNFLPEEVIKVL